MCNRFDLDIEKVIPAIEQWTLAALRLACRRLLSTYPGHTAPRHLEAFVVHHVPLYVALMALYRYCVRVRSIVSFWSLNWVDSVTSSTSSDLDMKSLHLPTSTLPVIKSSLPPPTLRQATLELNWTRTKPAELNTTTFRRKRADLSLFRSTETSLTPHPFRLPNTRLVTQLTAVSPFPERPVPPNPLAFLKWQCQKRWEAPSGLVHQKPHTNGPR